MTAKDSRSNSKIVLALAAYTSASVFGPMLTLGIVGFFIDKKFGTNPKFLLISIGIAFVVSNTLLFKRQRFLSKKMSVTKKEESKKDAQTIK